MRLNKITTVLFFTLSFLLAAGIASLAQDGELVPSADTSTTTASSASGTSTSGTSGVDSSRPKVAVYTFENPPNYYNSTIGNGLTSIIVTHMAQSGRFDVIQRGENLDLIIDEIALGESGIIEGSEATERGHVRGVDYILSGQVTNFGYEETDMGGFLGGFGGFGGIDVSQEEAVVRIDFSLIDATTGMTVLAASAEGKESETGVGLQGGNWGDWIGSISYDSDEFMDSMVGHATLKAVDNLFDQILALFPIQAPILAVLPGYVILDIGVGAGIEEGMEFDVYRVEEITNSAGEVVWENRELIGRVRITEVVLTGCKAEIISGSGFLEGDLAILPEDEDD